MTNNKKMSLKEMKETGIKIASLKRVVKLPNGTCSETELMEFDNVHCCQDTNGILWYKTEDVVRALGYQITKVHKDRIIKDCPTEVANNDELSHTSVGQQCYISKDIQWFRINQYLALFGYPPLTQEQKEGYIPENMVYKLGFHGKNQKSINFQNLVADKILPHFKASVTEQELKEIIEKQQSIINKLEPKADFYDMAMESEDTFPSSVMAKDFGWSAQQFHTKLQELGIIYQIGKQWVLYDSVSDLGLTLTQVTSLYDKKKGCFVNVKLATNWTHKGREYLYKRLTEAGYPLQLDEESEGVPHVIDIIDIANQIINSNQRVGFVEMGNGDIFACYPSDAGLPVIQQIYLPNARKGSRPVLVFKDQKYNDELI